jgi:transaldolase
MPEATLRAVADHGRVPDGSLRGHYDDVVQTLEDNGVAAFEAGWDQLSDQLAQTMRSRGA